MRYIVVEGNFVSGFTFYGPFDSEDEAADWGDETLEDIEWEVCPLEPKVVDWGDETLEDIEWEVCPLEPKVVSDD